ncbi:MAG: hypothetical protein KA477_00885 [Candidatus Levybacteria bacterium]|nr:hypothetical protein [Candidatus Levybacteria bacterium]
MLKKILLDGKEFHFTRPDLPIFIHGEEHVGASLFTVSVLADLYAQGSKIIALTGYPMARDEFEEQTGAEENAKFFTKENEELFITNIQTNSDVNDRVILIKNIELFSEEIFNTVKDFSNVIISGDLNKCSFKEKILQKSFNTSTYFSPLDEALPELQEYEGYFVSQNNTGRVSLEV